MTIRSSPAGHQLRVHHHARHAPVAVRETGEPRQPGASRRQHAERAFPGSEENSNPRSSVPSTSPGATNTVLPARFSIVLKRPGPISGRPCITRAWRSRSSSANARAPLAARGHPAFVRHHSPGSQNIVSVCRPFGRYDALEHDVGRFPDLEFGPLDEVREIRLVKRKRRPAFRRPRRRRSGRRREFAKLSMQRLKQVHPVRVVGASSRAGLRRGSRKSGLPGAQKAADQPVEIAGRVFKAKLRRNGPDLVAQPGHPFGAAAPDLLRIACG